MPYAEAINALGFLEPKNENTTVVTDADEALYHLLNATKLITNTAMEYCKINKAKQNNESKKNQKVELLAGDDLLPILIYCVIQSSIQRPHRLIYYIENILPKETVDMGAAAYALSGLKGIELFFLYFALIFLSFFLRFFVLQLCNSIRTKINTQTKNKK